jgi:uncharacterized protein (DUF1800 family)
LAVAIAAMTIGLTGQSEPVRAQTATFEIVARHSGKCLDVTGGSVENGAEVIQWICNRGANQHWASVPAGDGSYFLVAQHSGKCLDVTAASGSDGARIIQWICHGGANQRWTLAPAGDGSYSLVAQHSEKCLTVDGASLDNLAAVLQLTCAGAAHQHWDVRPSGSGGAQLSSADVVRFLEQSTWGPTPELIEHVRTVGFERFLDEQFAAPASSYPRLALYPTTRDTTTCPNGSACQRDNYTMYPLQARFFTNALYGEDQLRQRIAFALHQIIVVSGVEITQPSWMAPYLQTLDRNAFGNFRQLLFEITVNPAMGNYLDVTGNSRTRPNENYAREILQLFSIGTVRLNTDGTPQLDASGQSIPTYGQEEINNFARVFTGWVRAAAPASGVPNYIDPMVVNASNHDTQPKTLLDGSPLPANQSTVKDTNDALDNIFRHPNVGPFIAKQLIQHLVSSNPSPGYVARVAGVFDGETSGTRGDLKAVIRAILLDPEARGDLKTDPGYGHLRHPALFITSTLRALNARSADGASASDGYLNPQSTAMGMDVFRPPSVFSYFSPATGVPGAGKLRGPEFGLLSTSTALARANFVNTIVFSRINVSANAPSGTSIDLSSLLPMTSEPGRLVDALNDLLLHGSMSPDMRAGIVTAVNAVAASNSLKRARTAVYLVLTSSQYQVEK